MFRKIVDYFTSEEFVNAQTDAAMRRVRYYRPMLKGNAGDKRRK